MTSATVFQWQMQILTNSAAQFVKFHGTVIPCIPWPVVAVVLTDNASKYKVFIVTCNTRKHSIFGH